MKPTVGRIVHYVARGSADGKFPKVCRAAQITEVDGKGHIGLIVANPTGLFFHPIADGGGCPYDDRPSEQRDGGTWHWPEREE